MLEQRKKARPSGELETLDDIRNFRAGHPRLPEEITRHIRNAYYCHVGTTGYLQAMWEHVIECERCRSRIARFLPK